MVRSKGISELIPNKKQKRKKIKQTGTEGKRKQQPHRQQKEKTDDGSNDTFSTTARDTMKKNEYTQQGELQ